MRVEVDVCPSDFIDEVTDDFLVEELKSRGFVVVPVGGKSLHGAAAVESALQDALAGRMPINLIRDCLMDAAGVHLVEAFEAALRGNRFEMLNHLDRAHCPTDAAKATQLPL